MKEGGRPETPFAPIQLRMTEKNKQLYSIRKFRLEQASSSMILYYRRKPEVCPTLVTSSQA